MSKEKEEEMSVRLALKSVREKVMSATKACGRKNVVRICIFICRISKCFNEMFQRRTRNDSPIWSR
jgi:hypothetical protein